MARSLSQEMIRLNSPSTEKTIAIEHAEIPQEVELVVIDEKGVEICAVDEFKLGTIVGEIGARNFNFPRLSIAQAVGEQNMRMGWLPGSIILKKEVKICDPKEEVNFTVLRLKVYYEEEMPYNPDKPLRRFETMTEVTAAGLSISDKTARDVADIHILLECPKPAVRDHFSINIGDKYYTFAIWTVRKSAFARAARTIITEVSFLKREMLSLRWKLSAHVEKVGQFMVAVPAVSIASVNTPEEIALLVKTLSSNPA